MNTRLVSRYNVLAELLRSEATGGILLMVTAAVALVWANSPWAAAYADLWAVPLAIGVEPAAIQKPLLLWINDGLMALFFLLVGLEIKREVVDGQLASLRQAALPLAAAVGGMVVPAGLYALVTAGGPYAAGWGIPMATDIAFALGVLTLLGPRVPASLKLFLLALAIVDDLGAVMVIALFYTAEVSLGALGAAAAATLVLLVFNRTGVARSWPYLLVGLVLWVAVLKSGVHATIAGVVLAFTIPLQAGGRRPLEGLEHALHKPVAFLVLPIFALANAGVALGGGADWTHPAVVGIALGLFVGKQAGVLGFAWVAVRAGWAALPAGATWRHVYGVSLLTGIGFTMSLFVASLAFADATALAAAKLGIVGASVVAALVGVAVLLRTPAPARTQAASETAVHEPSAAD